MSNLKSEVDNFASNFLKVLKANKEKEVFVVSHFDTDGITSASIMIKALKRLDCKFSVKIIKSLEKPFIERLPKGKIIFFLDLASGSLDYLNKTGIEHIFIIDHHEISGIEGKSEIPDNVRLLNPQMLGKEKISSAGLAYLFSKSISNENRDLLKLGVLGMIGDQMESEISILESSLDEEIQTRRGLLIYPSTRPLNRTLEYSSNPYIPGVTGNSEGVRELLRDSGIAPVNGNYKSLIELNEEEMQKLVTGIMLRNPSAQSRPFIGDIFLIKFFNKLEDARELSAMVNACSRLGHSAEALKFCMEFPDARKDAEAIHVTYKQHLISGLEFVKTADKIKGNGLLIINAKSHIKDTIVGTIASILSNSPMYDPGTVIVTMAYYEDKIKVSSRICGREADGNGRNLKELLESVISNIGGEVGGHQFAAGCIISQDQEESFIEKLKEACEIEMVKI